MLRIGITIKEWQEVVLLGKSFIQVLREKPRKKCLLFTSSQADFLWWAVPLPPPRMWPYDAKTICQALAEGLRHR
jgi:hypothetical protein